MYSFIRRILVFIVVLMLSMNTFVIKAVSNLNLSISFDEGYSSTQGHVEYKINNGSWISVSSTSNILLSDDVESMKIKVVPNQYYEVNFDDGPDLRDGGPGAAFNAGGMDEARVLLVGDGYDVTITDGLENITFSKVAFRETTATNIANLSISIQGQGLEYWQDSIPSRITLRLPGTQDIEFGQNNLTWKDNILPPNATGVSTTNPIQVEYDYDNSGEVTFSYVISNANTKITSLVINEKDYTSNCPQTDEQILANIDQGGRSTKLVSFKVPYSANYNVEIVAQAHDLMGGFGWNYLPEETLDGEARQDCIAHGTISFINGEYNGTIYNSVDEFNNAGNVFSWRDGNKNYTDEHDAWGEASFPKGAKITMKLIPDEGYQLVSLYGDSNVVPLDEVGVYQITMAGGMNSHLMASFIEVKDSIEVNTNVVLDGQVSNLENTYGEGSMRLSVNEAIIDEGSRQGFDSTASQQSAQIHDYVDISLDNLIYKASDNPDDSWSRSVTELSDKAQISLNLNENYSNRDLFIIHEHSGSYEIIDVEYDETNNSITFETDGFSNYALASRMPSEYNINVTTDGNGTFSGPSSGNAGQEGLMIYLEPSDGYVFDSLSAQGIDEGEDEETYSVLYSGWPTVAVLINKMPANDISFDVKFKLDDETENVVVESEDGNYSLELSDVPKGNYKLMVVDILSLDAKQREEMDIPEEMFNEIKKKLDTLSKDKGEMLALYQIIVLLDDDMFFLGSPYKFKVKVNDKLKGFDTYRLYDLSGVENDDYELGNGISVDKNNEYLEMSFEQLNAFLLLGNKKKPVNPDYIIPKTGIE